MIEPTRTPASGLVGLLAVVAAVGPLLPLWARLWVFAAAIAVALAAFAVFRHREF